MKLIMFDVLSHFMVIIINFRLNEWLAVPIHMDMCERTEKEPPWSIMLTVVFTRVIPSMYVFNDNYR